MTDAQANPAATTSPTGYGPAQFHGAYSLPTTASSLRTIAIVDAYDDPTIRNDLSVYSQTYGIPDLPTCTSPSAASACFIKVNQTGGTSSYPRKDAGWALEISLDVEMAHAICQNCKIILVEASSNSFANLAAAVDEAAASQYVTAVGGTTLNLNSSNQRTSEIVWSGAGSGCSAYEPKPSWQKDSGCARRTVADVSADADPNTGASVYDTTRYQGQSGWFQVGGTSLSAPLIGAVYALGTSSVTYGSYPYSHTSSLFDVTSGSNGSCGGSYLCTAVAGYDGPSGLGTPNGTGGF